MTNKLNFEEWSRKKRYTETKLVPHTILFLKIINDEKQMKSLIEHSNRGEIFLAKGIELMVHSSAASILERMLSDANLAQHILRQQYQDAKRFEVELTPLTEDEYVAEALEFLANSKVYELDESLIGAES